MSEKISNCPFCDSDRVKLQSFMDKGKKFYSFVLCESCFARGPKKEGFADKESAELCALDAWEHMAG